MPKSAPAINDRFDDLTAKVARLISAYKQACSERDVLKAENAELRQQLSPRPEDPHDPTADGEGRG